MLLRIGFIAILFSLASTVQGQADTTWVQTYTWEAQNNPATAYDSPGRRWFSFPASDNGESYQKILMYYTLKCFEDGTAGGLGYACGEWDYLTYTYLFDHTGLLDSTWQVHPRYLMNDADFETASLILMPEGGVPSDTLRRTFEVRDWGLEAAGVFGAAAGVVPGEAPAAWATAPAVRFQMRWTAEEWAAMGLQAGEVQVLDFPWAPSAWVDGAWVEVRMQSVAPGSVGPGGSADPGFWSAGQLVAAFATGAAGMDEAVTLAAGGAGWRVPLASPFTWDGASDVVVDFRCEAPEGVAAPWLGGTSGVSEATVAPGMTWTAAAAGRYLRLDGNDRVEVDAAALNAIEGAVTVEFWARGNAAYQPENNSIFEALGPQNQRELNVHLPWSNGRIYWDAGYDGGYDRIDQAATEAQYEGNWSHWAFVKDVAAETMSIYLNGALWHTGSDRDNPIGDLVRFHLGTNGDAGLDYRGDVDGFRVWGAALDPATVGAWRDREVTGEHPAAAALLADLDFDEEPAVPATGLAPAEPGLAAAFLHGDAGRVRHDAAGAFGHAAPLPGDLRPALQFWQGATDGGSSARVADFAQPIPPMSLTEWAVDGNAVVRVDGLYGWPADGLQTVWDEAGNVLAQYPIAGPQVAYTNEVLGYYGVPFEVVERVELARYITPYGIGLTLGDDGWTWVFDVTDYAPLLRDMVELEAGNWQELLDMKFAFVHGTPARDVKNVEAFWRGSFGLAGFAGAVLPHTYEPGPGEEQFRLKTRASGHGFGTGNNCAEFCYNTHSVAVNGNPQWSWEIMRECADNPLYPQGGTWIYDRAGWCPGAPVDTRDWELTPLVDATEPFEVGYGIEFDPYGNYVMEGQIIAYGPPNFVHDLEISEILAPSDAKVESRFNPICESPQVRIRNNGTAPVTACTFTYRVEGGAEATYTWTGNLAFLESTIVHLPYDDPSLVEGDDEVALTFEVRVDLPAPAVDGQLNNNATSISFHRVPTWSYNGLDDNRIIVWTKTNSVPWETTVELRDAAGNLVWSRGYPGANTTYQDTLSLNAGCYRFTVYDSGDDGQSFWANNDGSGYTRLKKVAGGNFIAFEPDFGKSISQAFYFATNLVNVAEQAAATATWSVQAFPNPTSGELHARFTGYRSGEPVEWIVRDALGRERTRGTWRGTTGELQRLDLSGLGSGLVHIEWIQGLQRTGQWILME